VEFRPAIPIPFLPARQLTPDPGEGKEEGETEEEKVGCKEEEGEKEEIKAKAEGEPEEKEGCKEEERQEGGTKGKVDGGPEAEKDCKEGWKEGDLKSEGKAECKEGGMTEERKLEGSGAPEKEFPEILLHPITCKNPKKINQFVEVPEDSGNTKAFEIVVDRRVRIDYAGEDAANAKLRFSINGNNCVSVPQLSRPEKVVLAKKKRFEDDPAESQ
jgi:hypothetical protein